LFENGRNVVSLGLSK